MSRIVKRVKHGDNIVHVLNLRNSLAFGLLLSTYKLLKDTPPSRTRAKCNADRVPLDEAVNQRIWPQQTVTSRGQTPFQINTPCSSCLVSGYWLLACYPVSAAWTMCIYLHLSRSQVTVERARSERVCAAATTCTCLHNSSICNQKQERHLIGRRPHLNSRFHV